MTQPSASASQVFYRDLHFWIAVAAAPLLWWLAVLWWQPVIRWDWPLRAPHELVYFVLLYPVIEEVLFRGLLQGALLRRASMRRACCGISIANVLVSLVFTALHFIAHPPLAAAAVMLPSLVFGYFRDRHGSLQAPILLHVFYNLGYFWLFTG